MKKSNLQGFGAVFSHNLRIHMKEKKYLISTIIISLVLILGIGGLIFFLSEPDESEDEYDYNVKKVYVVDETGLGIPDYQMLAAALEMTDVAGTEFITCDKSAKDMIEDENVEYLVDQTEEDGKYILNVITGKNVEVDGQIDKNLSVLSDLLEQGFKSYIYMSSGLTGEQIVQVLLPVNSTVEEIGGKEYSEGREIIGLASIFVFLMLVYFMVIIYGVQICADVPMEKNSKLVEQLLLSVSPYALVSGKILSMIVSCIIQFIIWVASAVVGIFAGDYVAKAIYDVDTSAVSSAMDLVKEMFDGVGFTAPTIILMVVLLSLGLVFYLLLAGIGGAMLSKPENAGNVQMIFMMPLLISFFAILYGSGITSGNYVFPIAFNLIPFTAAMCAPASVLIGSLSIPMALLCVLINVVCALVLLWVAAKVYEGLLFFNGNKVKLQDVLNVFKSSK